MTDPVNDCDFVDLAADLLTHYSFDLAGKTVGQLIEAWIQLHPPTWLRAAVVEALYQGRYKAVSVGQILNIWSRRGHPICHFNLEFERIVCEPVISSPDISPIADELDITEPQDMSDSNVSKEQHEPEVLNLDDCISHHFEKAERFIHGAVPAAQDIKQNPETRIGVAPVGIVDDEVITEEGDRLLRSGLSGDAPFGLEERPLSIVDGTDPHQPIHRFVPQTHSSLFHSRLQAMASSSHALANIAQPHPPSEASDSPSMQSLSDNAHADSTHADGVHINSVHPNHSHLEHIQLPPKPDLEAIAASLQNEVALNSSHQPYDLADAFVQDEIGIDPEEHLKDQN